MLTWEDDVEVHALRKRGWSISAIARHTGFDRKTVRKYLAGDGTVGVRARPGPDPFDPFVDYVTARLVEDPHLWARTLLDELEELGFGLSYQSLTRNIRVRDLRPVCEACRTATQRPNAVIAHPPGDETQWDWLELPNPPESWGWGKTAHLLVGSLAHSGKWRAALSPSEDQPHLVAALDRVSRELGGLTRIWRFDRMATVCEPGSGRVTASFAGVASTTAWRWQSARRGAVTARAWWRRSTTPPRSGVSSSRLSQSGRNGSVRSDRLSVLYGLHDGQIVPLPVLDIVEAITQIDTRIVDTYNERCPVICQHAGTHDERCTAPSHCGSPT